MTLFFMLIVGNNDIIAKSMKCLVIYSTIHFIVSHLESESTFLTILRIASNISRLSEKLIAYNVIAKLHLSTLQMETHNV